MHAERLRVQTGMVDGEVTTRNLPAGTVTFLLTDVEGSTRLWQDRPAEMGSAIARHYEILDGAIRKSGGVRPVEQGEGDSVVGVFVHAIDALRAAIDAQVLLVDQLPWLAVRMAIHTGDALLRDEGNYVGGTIIRCARLRACGHGAQILVSETTAPLVAVSVIDGLALRDLGRARLRDLNRAERVWQVEHPELPATFPPLRSLDHAPNNLPSPLTSFIGRDREQAIVAGLVGLHRLVTLTGSGGSGKTRLALHAAADVIGAHAGGTWWVELGPVLGPGEVAECIAMATGLRPAPGVDILIQIARGLRESGPVLIVLDNAEHVLDETARIAEQLLSGCPDLRILATSREPIGVSGEIVWRVPSLSTPDPHDSWTLAELCTFDAVRLFLDRARLARPNLVLDEQTAGSIASICARLDGVPLALELAAARVRTLPLDRLARGLHDAFRLLTGGSRTTLARQQTLLASIAWSIDLLDSRERLVLRRLAVFPTTFTLDAAEGVAADEGAVDAYSVLELIGRLVDKSLVQLDDVTGRYRMLETIRQYCMERLQEIGDTAATRTRHAAYYAQWCGEVGEGRHGIDRAPLHCDMPNVVVAMQWAREHEPALAYAVCRGLTIRASLGHYEDLADTCDWLAAGPADDELASAWAGAAATQLNASFTIGHHPLAALRDVIEAQLAEDDLAGRRRLSWYDAVLLSMRDDGDIRPLRASIGQVRDAGNDLELSMEIGYVALAHVARGLLETGQELVAEARMLAKRCGVEFTVDVIGSAYTASILLAIHQGRLSDATAHANASRPHNTSIGIWVAHSLAYTALLTDDVDLMRTAQSSATRETPGTGHFGQACIEMFAAVNGKAFSDAVNLAEPVLPLIPQWLNRILWQKAVNVALVELGQIDRMAELTHEVENARDVITAIPLALAELELLRLQVAIAHGQDDTALDAAHRLLNIALERGFALLTIDALESIAIVADRRHNRDVAAQLLASTRAERQRTGYRFVMTGPRDDHDALVARTALLDQAMSITEAVEYARRSRGRRGRPSRGWDSITPTEHKVLELIIDGRTNAAIGRQLAMRPATVKTHLTHLFNKLDVANRAQLAAFATLRRSERPTP